MKKFFLLLLVMVPVLGFSQEKYQMKIDSAAKRVYFKEVFEFPGLNTSEIKDRIKGWIAKEFTGLDLSKILETNNSVSFQYYVEIPFGGLMIQTFNAKPKILIDIKDEKCRILIDNFSTSLNYTIESYILKDNFQFRSTYKALRENTIKLTSQTIHSFYTSIGSKKDDNW